MPRHKFYNRRGHIEFWPEEPLPARGHFRPSRKPSCQTRHTANTGTGGTGGPAWRTATERNGQGCKGSACECMNVRESCTPLGRGCGDARAAQHR